jgi:hypothetical protein
VKKLTAILLVLGLLFGMTACSCDNTSDPSSNTTEAQQNVLSGTMEENVNKLMQANPAEFMGGMMPLDLQDTSEEGLWALKNYTGLDSAEKLTDAAVYEPMTGSQAFSLVLVRVADSANPKDVAQKMKDNIDPRKWICAMADQVMVAGYQDTVMFIMVDSQLGKTAQSYVDAFKNLCGGKLDFTI